MFCNRCGKAVVEGQRFCTNCGASLRGITEPTEPLRVRPDLADDEQGDAVRPADGSRPDAGWPPPASTGAPPAGGSAGGSEHDAVGAAMPPTVELRVDDASSSAPVEPPASPGPQLYDFIADEDTEEHPPPVTEPPTAAVPTGVVAATPPAPEPAPGGVPTGGGWTGRTDEFPLVAEVAPPPPPRPPFAIGPASGMGALTMVVALVAAVANVVSISTDAADPLFDVGDWTADDLGSNLMIAGFIGAAMCLIGAIAAGFHQRWGAGLAGGAGLAIAGWGAIVVGLAEQPVAVAERVVTRPTEEPFTITITRDLGYWLALAAGALGVLTFVVSLVRAGNDRRSGLNPWLAALGAVASLIAAAGPLLPVGNTQLELNWTVGTGPIERPTAYVVGRLVQVGLLAFAGMFGFLLVRRYGLGLVIGAASVCVWLVVSTLVGFGDAPVGPAVANPGAPPDDLHGITVFGFGALTAITLLALLAAYNQTVRER